MARSTKFYGEWAKYDGRKVTINGLRYRLKCRIYRQRYPYEDEVIDVSAEPVNKASRVYRETKRLLGGDDWSTDVLASSIELQAEIERQLQSPKIPATI